MLPQVNLAPAVETASGEPPRRLTVDEVKCALGHDTDPIKASGFDPAIIAECESFNALVDAFLANERVGHYLTHLTPQNVYMASGVRVLTLEAIRDEIHELSPGAAVFRFGYLPVASSIGGHAICVSIPSTQVSWVPADRFSEGEVYSDDGDLRRLCHETVAQAVTVLNDDCERFLDGLLRDSYEDLLDALDSNGSPN